MPGPCSVPAGTSKTEYEEMFHMVCDLHVDCTPDSHKEFNKDGEPIAHAFVTKRMWLAKRNRLRTGKTV